LTAKSIGCITSRWNNISAPRIPAPSSAPPTPPAGGATSASGKLRGGVLYLKDIQAWTQQGEAGLEALFPGQQGPVAATWFTGKLIVPQGKVLKGYVPYPIYEKYLMITVEKGRVVRQETIDNPGGTRPPGR